MTELRKASLGDRMKGYKAVSPTFHYCPAEGHDGCPDAFLP